MTAQRKAAGTGIRAASNTTDSRQSTATRSHGAMRGKSASTLALEAAIIEIVAERHPITVRGICYGLFVRGLLTSMATGETQRVSRVATAMREAGTLDWQLIVDGSRAVERVSAWRDPNAIIRAAVLGYRRDRWQDQPRLVEVWSEKSTIQGVLAPVLEEYGVTFRVMKGFGSFTAVRQAAEDSLKIRADRDGIVLYLGDRDPSGMFMSERDLPGRLERYGSRWEFLRIAVTEADTIGLPSFDVSTKAGDSRCAWYLQHFGNKAWEIDAIDPNALRQRVEEQISTRLNLLTWKHAAKIEAIEIASMKSFHAAWLAAKGRPTP